MAAVSHDTDEVWFLENEGSEGKRELRGKKWVSKLRPENEDGKGRIKVNFR